ncbi:uncharacterized protein CIMG_07084 [Coccidioides immitis RS]|uniref:YCII-related domain-containing protein n=6 Tax=Coccidioides TaxID=5500 RepID=J3K9L2_COCIM|nr:uncharacterized protein CIMG_07084 [Coccidioides immitis RS]XP_003070232.1 YCII-related domain containing protein [Coccidioides posadasii C735 delta SOWgp]KMM68119.1 hypothetical protein CPAG_04451 [Coccidioides posadasii RMSCC 3488]KMP04254.1 hypothetical protein CIRG_03945 [Coccidioides immitis RMSCC 2394]KMU73385.1 hypothetical protein CISG_03520 [Coccidioides immitis RMSCC 3703]KMU87074.1 hypothetical protein CIHG_05014 [Coccidioides immitis H538.4]TPX24358.1 hypothetical protein DIZ76|eukprot:XP_003070232.1 YCII-related domain containing protein [Coccidioides posadasii C735 delta SOWgp]
MSQQYDWLIQIRANTEDLEGRINTRPAHLVHNKPLIEAGKILFGGPLLAHQPESPDADLAVTGSVMLIRAGTEEEVRQLVREDPYAKVGFWDVENAVVSPFRCVVRKKTA